MNDINSLKKDLAVKIQNLFKDHQGYLNYLLHTKQNFLHRYLETSTEKNIELKQTNAQTIVAISYENNMGEAFKSSDSEIKEGVKKLAKTIPRQENPKVKYSLQTTILNLDNPGGKILIESAVNWGFPDFIESAENQKEKKVIFEFHDPNTFRKELALKYEEACEIFN